MTTSPMQTDPQQWLLPSWPWTLRAVGITCLVGAEVSHTAVLEAGFAAWFWAGMFFAVAAALEGLLAILLAVRPSRGLYLVAVAMSVAMATLGLVSRTAGLPVGAHGGEPAAITGVDLVPMILESAATVALIALAYSGRLRDAAARGRGRGGSMVAAAMILATVGAFSVFGGTLADQAVPSTPAEAPAVHVH
jgi:hypothetical protein